VSRFSPSSIQQVILTISALRKTAHLLKALSSALPPPPDNASDLPEPITYHPLDLSRPELHRVLGEMDEAYGKELNGKVSCIGLHGDYEAGLQMIRDGKLHELRGKQFGPQADEDAISLASSSPVQRTVPIHKIHLDDQAQVQDNDHDSYQTRSAAEFAGEAIRPEDLTSPVPSAITDESSEVSKNDLHSSGTWSPIENSSPGDAEGDGNQGPPSRPLHYLFLGSSLGNFDRSSAAPFLKSLPLKPGDTLLLGLDGRPPPGEEGRKKVEMAYNDPAGHTRAFEEHGWDVVKHEMGINESSPGVEFVGRYNEEMGRHEAYFRSKGKQGIKLSSGEVTLDEGELLNIEWSFKVS
jgi:hypothetical protein